MAHEFVIKNGFVLSGTTISGISNNSGLTNNSNSILTENAVKLALESAIQISKSTVYNNTTSTITKGSAVKIQSAINGVPNITTAISTNIGNNQVAGLVENDMPSGTTGLIITSGILSGLNLSGYTIGDIVYLSDTIPGGYINSTSSLQFSSRTNQIGYITDTGTTTGKIFVSINNEDINLSLTDIERNILEGNTLSTGVYEYTGMTKTSSTTFNLSNIKGWIVKNTYNYATKPDVLNIINNGYTGLTTPYLNTSDSTHVLVNSSNTLTFLPIIPTPQQRRENIYLGKIVHPDRQSILTINNLVDYDVSPMSSLRDMFTSIKLINDGIVISANGANLNINLSAGKLYGMGINWVNNQLNPNQISINSSSPASFLYRTQTGGTSTAVTYINPTVYDLNGNITTVPTGGDNKGNRSTNQRVYLFPTGIINIQYGQTVYDSLPLALAAMQSEKFTKSPNATETGLLLGLISLRRNTTDLSDTAYAIFSPASIFGESIGSANGSSTTTLQQTYDNSSTPEIITDNIRGALSLKNGTGISNTTNIMEGLDSGNTITSYIMANGRMGLSDAVLNTEATSLQQLNSGLTTRQPLSTNLTSLSGLTYASASFVKMTGANIFSLDTNTYVLTSEQIIANSGTGSIIGGGDLSSNRTLTLQGDSPIPGNSKLYGTDSNGTKGWYNQPVINLGLVQNSTGFTISGGTSSTKSLTINNNITFNGADNSTLNINSGGTLGSAAFTQSSSYQPISTNLSSLSGLSYTSTSFVKMTGANTFALDTNTYTLTSVQIIANSGTGSIIGGGDLSSNRTLTLQGDSSIPGNSKLYGTNSGGTKGWYDQPTTILSLIQNSTGFTISGGTSSAKSLTVNNNISLNGADNSTLNINSGGTLGSAAFTQSSSYQPISTNLTSLSALTYSSTAFVKMISGNTFALDNTNYTTLTGIGYVTGNLTGFADNTPIITFASGTTRTLYVTPSGASFDLYMQGKKITKTTTESIQISDVEGGHYIYYNTGGTLEETTTFDDSYIMNYAPVAMLYWDSTNKKAILRTNEKHNVARERFIHRYIHTTIGTGYVSGLSLYNFTIGDGSLSAHTQFSVENGELFDEDIEININNNSPQQLQVLNAPVFYLSGTSWRSDGASTTPFKSYTGATSRLAYNKITNGSGSQAECADNTFVNYYAFATNNVDYPILMVQGSVNYNSLSLATQDVENAINMFVNFNPTFIEYSPIGAIIVKTSSSFTNSKKAAIVNNNDGNNYKDLRVNNKRNKYTPNVTWDELEISVSPTGSGDFLTLKDAVDWFNNYATSNVLIRLNSGIHQVADTVTINNPNYSCSILGNGVYISTLTPVSGITNKPIFNVLSESHYSRFDINCFALNNYGTQSTENGFNINAAIYAELKDIVVFGAYNGLYTTTQGADIWMIDAEISHSKQNAMLINGANLTHNICWFENNKTSVYLYSGQTLNLEIKNSTFVINTGQTGILYNGTGMSYDVLSISNNTFNLINSAVTVTSGFDFTTQRDCNIRMVGNTGLIDNTPKAYIQFKNNATTTTLTTQNTYYKVAGTNTTSNTRKFTIANNRATYLPALTRNLAIFMTGSVSAGANTRTLSMGIYKNGTTLIEEVEVYCATSTSYYPFVVNTEIETVSVGDFFELWATCTSNAGPVITVRDFQFIIRS